MYNASLVNRFLIRVKASPARVKAVQVRMVKVLDAVGNFPPQDLKKVLRSKKSVDAFERSWNMGQLFSETSTK